MERLDWFEIKVVPRGHMQRPRVEVLMIGTPLIELVATKVFALLFFLCVFTSTVSSQNSGHTNDILEVQFNANASKLMSYSAGDGWLMLWEIKSRQLLWRSKTEFIQKGDEYYTLRCFAFSPDETRIVSGSGNGTVQLWDAATGKLLWRASPHKDSVTAVGFSPDGKTIASAASPKEEDDEIKILRIEDGAVIKKLQGKPCTVISLQFSEKGDLLKTGTLGESVSQWDLTTGKQLRAASSRPCSAKKLYDWETSYTLDLNTAVTRTGEKEITLKDTQTNTIKKTLAADGYRIYSRFSADGKKLVFSGYGEFTFYDLVTGESRKIPEFSRTGSTFDLSLDGSLFAEGGSWGNAAIKITETLTGKSYFLDGKGHRVAPYQPGELETRLAKEKAQQQALLKAAQTRRDQQAAIDIKKFGQLVYISFSHYGEMTPSGQNRIAESPEPNKSKVRKAAKESGAVWLRLHNDSPLPIHVPTQSMYFSDHKCFYEYGNGKKLSGLCDGNEISVWHGLEDRNGKTIPYGYDFGSGAILLPQTSVLFAVQLDILQNQQAVRFNVTFQKETNENKIENYGQPITLRFKQSDLRNKN